MASPQNSLSSKDWSIDHLLSSSDNFLLPRTVDASSPDLLSVIQEYDALGLPLIVQGWHKHDSWKPEFFNAEYFSDSAPEEILVRDIHSWSDKYMKTHDFFVSLEHTPQAIQKDETTRYYAKDVQCPVLWEEWLLSGKSLPQCLCPNAEDNVLPDSSEIETLMCYIGVGDTATPAHKDLCASTGQNLMMCTDGNGSSFWFMTASSASPDAVDYFHDLGHELDHESHFTSPQEFARAPFPVYIWEQKLGDLIVIPPRCCHQVTNHGGMTIKMSWSRLSLSALPAALYHELPVYQRVCRRETYRIKETIRSALRRKYHDLTGTLQDDGSDISADLIQQTQDLLALYATVLTEEEPPRESSKLPIQTGNSSHASDSGLFCDFCGADVFNAYFECDSCTAHHDTVLSEEVDCEGYCVCPRCFVEGRSCGCRSMQPRLIQLHSILEAEFEQVQSLLDLCLERSTSIASSSRTQPSSSRCYPTNGVRIFTAALQLLQDRERATDPSSYRACNRYNRKGGHQVALDGWHTCKKCHAGTCLRHILSDHHVHAAEVFLARPKDKTSEIWHQRHKEATALAKSEEMKALIQNEANADGKGLAPINHLLHLSRTASRFPSFKPLSQSYCHGWYDEKCAHITFVTSSGEADVVPEDLQDDAPPATSEYSGTDSTQQTPTSTSGKRKLLLPFVGLSGLHRFQCCVNHAEESTRSLGPKGDIRKKKKRRTE